MGTKHEENCKKICLLCFGKTKTMFFITGKLKTEVEKVFDYNSNDDCLPKVICSTCKSDLYTNKVDSGKEIKLSIFPEIKLKPATRSNTVCDCYICQLAKMPRCGNFAKGNTLPPRKSILVNLNKPSTDESSGKFNFSYNNFYFFSNYFF